MTEFIYKPDPERYKYKTWKATSKEAEEYYKSRGYEERPWKEVLEIARREISRARMGQKVRVAKASKKFLEEIPSGTAGIFKRDGKFLIMLAPDMRYLRDSEIQEIVRHELKHIEEWEV